MFSNQNLVAQLRRTAAMISMPLTVTELGDIVEIRHHKTVVRACMIRTNAGNEAAIDKEAAFSAIRLTHAERQVILLVANDTVSELQAAILRTLTSVASLPRMFAAKLVPCRWCALPIYLPNTGRSQDKADCPMCCARAASEICYAATVLGRDVMK